MPHVRAAVQPLMHASAHEQHVYMQFCLRCLPCEVLVAQMLSQRRPRSPASERLLFGIFFHWVYHTFVVETSDDSIDPDDPEDDWPHRCARNERRKQREKRFRKASADSEPSAEAALNGDALGRASHSAALIACKPSFKHHMATHIDAQGSSESMTSHMTGSTKTNTSSQA